MKTIIEYATFCEATVYETNGDSWSYNYTFSNLREAEEWARFQIEVRPLNFEIDRIYITDSDTGEILLTCRPDDAEDDEEPCDDWGYNEDMGFDPYIGCYTDDC